ncbi:MobF family relaxase [Microterricola viridarii]|nr:MobF family relaxase [Microterricola viridarii]
MRVMSAGDGYKYLLRTIAAGDGDRSLSTPLTRYYSAKGTPPGLWMGGGVSGLGSGGIRRGDAVTERQLQLLIGLGRDPVSGEQLGRAYPAYSAAARNGAPTTEAQTVLGPTEPVAAEPVTGQPEAACVRRAVAGYDFTFSIPKSASILWGIADAPTQAIIARAHHEAVADVVAFMEREVAATRTGATAGNGAAAQVDVSGLIATAFDHFDSRAGDPHLHTHVVVSNKVRTVLDGKWRSLDGRPLHGAVVALSELHETLFADALTRALGVQWEKRERGRDRNPTWAISSVPVALVAEFSTRAKHIDEETDRLISAFVSAHGHRPKPTTVMKLRAQATLATRPAKEVHSLAELTATWRQQANRVLGADAGQWAKSATSTPVASTLRADELPATAFNTIGRSVMGAVSEKRSTWRHWNLLAEAARQTMGFRFATASDREQVIERVVAAAEQASLRLSPPELATSPAAFRREDGTSVFRPRYSTVFSSTELLDAETRLLQRGADTSGPRVTAMAPTESVRRAAGGWDALGDDQLRAVIAVAGSGHVLDVLVGPAGAGKTTTMSALRHAWEAQRGPGSVLGLAPSAAAAGVLAQDLGIPTENLAMWWQNHLTHGTTFESGQLVIIDEASLAGTMALDRITRLASGAGAKVLLVGDHAQLQSADAGGAFALLVHDRTDAPELLEVRRFTQEWERAASLELRHGNTEAVDDYVAHGRVHEGSADDMADAAYVAWREDTRAAKVSVLVSGSNEALAALNARARADGILAGRIDARRETALHDGTAAAVGDTIITRRNDRDLRATGTWVRNGDRWTVLAVRRNGALEVRRLGRQWGSTVVLPGEYAERHVELGYAVSAFRAQGLTTDTAHVVVAPGGTRESFYVAMTRGRDSNTAYVAIERPDAVHSAPLPGDEVVPTGRSVLAGVLQHVSSDPSAHETLAAEQDGWGSIAQLTAEYETIAASAQHERWAALVQGSGLSAEQAASAIASDAFGSLGAELRRAEAHHSNVESLLGRVVRARGFDDAQDIAAVLRARIMRVGVRNAGAARTRNAPRLIAGLIPLADGPMPTEYALALAERHRLIEARADALVRKAIDGREAWIRSLGSPPVRSSSQAVWRRSARIVAAYRERYGISSARPLGAAPATDIQAIDAGRARAAMEVASALAQQDSGQFGAQLVTAHRPLSGAVLRV